MRLSPTIRPFVRCGGILVALSLAFFLGQMTNRPNAAAASADEDFTRTGSLKPPAGENARVGHAFAADGIAGDALTLEQVTGGQPLDVWLKKILAQRDPYERLQNCLKVLEVLKTPDEMKAALKVVAESLAHSTATMPFKEYGMFLSRFTQISPQEAMAFARGQAQMPKYIGIMAVLSAWTRLDSDAALAWAKDEGLKVRKEIGGDSQDNFAMKKVMETLARRDLERALSVAASDATASPDYLNSLGRSLATEVRKQRAPEAARKLAESMLDGPFKNAFVSEIARQSAYQDISGTLQWTMALPDGEAKRGALAKVIFAWAETDVAAAGKFMAALPASAESDSARESYAYQVEPKNPQTAVTWAKTITDPERRDTAIQSVVTYWLLRDPGAALSWLNQSDLSEQQKAKIKETADGWLR